MIVKPLAVVELTTAAGPIYLSDGPYHTWGTDSSPYVQSELCVREIGAITTRIDGADSGDIELLRTPVTEALLSEDLAGNRVKIYRLVNASQALVDAELWADLTVDHLGGSSRGLYLRISSLKAELAAIETTWTVTQEQIDVGNRLIVGSIAEYLPTLINGVTHEYAATVSWATTIQAVYDNGNAVPFSALSLGVWSAYTTGPKPGTRFKLNAAPAGAVTVESNHGGVIGPYLLLDNILSGTGWGLTQRTKDLLDNYVANTSPLKLPAADYVTGLVSSAGETFGSLIDQFCASIGGTWRVVPHAASNILGLVDVYVTQDPVSAVAEHQLSPHDVVQDSLALSRFERQAKSTTLQYRKNYAYSGDEDRAKYDYYYLIAGYSNPSPGKLAEDVTWSTLLYDTADAVAEVSRRAPIRDTDRRIWKFQAYEPEYGPGVILNLVYPGYAFENGQQLMVHSISRNFYSSVATVEGMA